MKRAITILLAILLLLGAVTPALAGGTPFTDVQSECWYGLYVTFVHRNGIMQGTSATTFSPNANFTRAQVAAALFRIHNGRAAGASDPRASTFTDVPENQWFAPYIAWASTEGIVNGVGDNRFAPNDAVDRQQFATMLNRFADALTNLDTSIRQGARWNDFTDRKQIASWAVDGLAWANYHGIVTGRTATTIAPAGTATRAEAAAMLTRFMRLVERLSADFVLTISVEETTLPQGESFRVDVEFRNNSGECHEIVFDMFLLPIPGLWYWDGIYIDWPEPRPGFLETDHVSQARWYLGTALEPGTHRLRFRAAFWLNWGQDNQQQIVVESNTIVLIVQ